MHGFCAETSGALCLYLETWFGIPVSTTHTITGSIIGVGSIRGINAVKWRVAARVIGAWIMTIPLSAAMGAGTLLLCNLFGWRGGSNLP